MKYKPPSLATIFFVIIFIAPLPPPLGSATETMPEISLNDNQLSLLLLLSLLSVLTHICVTFPKFSFYTLC